MTSSKKESGQIIPVDAGKLAQGLKATFEGVAKVFDSIGVDADVRILETSVASTEISTEISTGASTETSMEAEPKAVPKTGTKMGSKKKEKNNGDETKDAADGSTDNGPGNGDVQSAGVSDDVKADEVTEAVEETAETKEAAGGKETDKPVAEPSVTQDDITKIIVQKIKQDRGNNEKIGQILKTYGVSKVGELDASKYEAFLTDISEL